MQINTGAARHEEPAKAVELAAKDLSPTAQFVVVSTPATTQPSELQAALRSHFPTAQLHISSSCLGSMTQAGPVLGDGAVSLCAFTDQLGAYGSAAGALDGQTVQARVLGLLNEAMANAEREGELPALVWLSGAPGTEEAAVDALAGELGGQVPIYGGSSADNEIAGQWFVGDRTGIHAQGIVVSVLYPNATVLHAFHSSYVPTGTSGVVTDSEGRTIRQIDGQPAAEVYNKWTDGAFEQSMGGGNILGASTMTPLAVEVGAIGGVAYHRLLHPETIRADGAITLFAEAETGEALHLLRGDEASLLSRAGRVAMAAMDGDAQGLDGIAGGLITYCAGCMLAIEPKLDQVVDSISKAMPSVPFIGQFTFGEQGTFPGGETCHGNLMISTVLFRRLI
ncbi:MAG: FIST N-terminal domain-containing protein [Myxococcota bacterium]|nr:FIST N-terminal domain-containing protein [Myxococcota bacterium]